MKERLKGILCIVSATMIWGAAFTAQTVGLAYVGPFTFQAVRCFLAVLGLIPVIVIADRISGKKDGFFALWKNKRLWFGGIVCGIPLFFACNLQQLGLVSTGAGKSAFLTAMYVLFVPVLGLFFHKKHSRYLPISVTLSVLGLYLLSSVGEGFALSDLLLLGCAFMFAVQIMAVDHFASGIDALRLNAIQALVCATLSAVCMFLLEKPEPANILSGWVSIAYAGFLSMGVAYALQITGQKKLESSTASLLMSLESVFAAIFAWILIQQAMSLYEILGSLLILSAIVIAQLPEKQPI